MVYLASDHRFLRQIADLWLWDYSPGLVLPESVCSRSSSHLFLVNRRDLNDFRTQTGVAINHIVLKPVSRATLATFLGVALTHLRSPDFWKRAASRSRRDAAMPDSGQPRLQEYDQDRTTFLARAVHDFRAPLTALSGYCGLLLSRTLGPLTESQREVLRRMLNSTKRLSRMAAAMFQLSVSRHVKRRPEMQRGDIRECLEQALHEITPFADDKSIEITTDLTPSAHAPVFRIRTDRAGADQHPR